MNHLIILTTALLFSFSTFCTGNVFFNKLNINNNDRLEAIVISYLFGFSIVSYIVFLVGSFGWLTQSLLIFISTVLVISTFIYFKFSNVYQHFHFVKSFVRNLARVCKENKIIGLIVLVFVIAVLFSLISALAPPSDADSLGWHLGGPDYFIRQGKIDLYPYYLYWGSPMLADMWNIIGLLFGSEILPQIFQWIMGLTGAIALYLLISERLSKRAGILAAVIYYLTPKIITLAGTAKYDLAFLTFIFISLHSLFSWKERSNNTWLWLSAIFTGLALSTKYQGMYWALSIGVLLVIMLWDKWKNNPVKALKMTFVFTGISLLVVSPWYLRNFLATGDPIWPFGYPIFNSQYWSQGLYDKYASWQQGPGESIWHYFMGLWNLTLNQSAWIGGLKIPYLPVQLALLPGLLFFWSELRNNQKQFLKYLAIPILVFYTLWFTSYQQSRYLLPAMSLLLVPSSYVFWEMMKLRIGKWAVLLLLCSTLFFSTVYSFIYNKQFFPVVFGLETKDEFLEKKVGFYKDIYWANENLPEDAKIFLNHLRPFYFERDFIIPPSYMGPKFQKMTSDEFFSYLEQEAITHIFDPNRRFEHAYKELIEKNKLVLIYSNPFGTRITSRTLGTHEFTSVNIYKLNHSTF